MSSGQPKGTGMLTGGRRSVGVQRAVCLREAATTTGERETKENGCEHSYTCWPDNSPFDESDAEAVLKWIRRTERSDAYLHGLNIVCKRLEAILKSNSSS
jgi:hypothetical protein